MFLQGLDLGPSQKPSREVLLTPLWQRRSKERGDVTVPRSHVFWCRRQTGLVSYWNSCLSRAGLDTKNYREILFHRLAPGGSWAIEVN